MGRTGALLCAGVLIAAPQAAGGAAEQLIAEMAGCFEVTYRFAEDGEHDMFSDAFGLEEPITEWVGLERDGEAMTLQHVSVTEDGRAVPHFHEVWTPETGGAWLQEVWSSTPDDDDRELRYQCAAAWELNRWACDAGRSAKPFRDQGAPFGFDRPDYEWLDRDNTVLVTDGGWVHQQDNEKRDADGELVSNEVGWITYRRVAEEHCAAAIDRHG